MKLVSFRYHLHFTGKKQTIQMKTKALTRCYMARLMQLLAACCKVVSSPHFLPSHNVELITRASSHAGHHLSFKYQVQSLLNTLDVKNKVMSTLKRQPVSEAKHVVYLEAEQQRRQIGGVQGALHISSTTIAPFWRPFWNTHFPSSPWEGSWEKIQHIMGSVVSLFGLC